MGEPTDDEPNASSTTSASRGDSIAAAASRALRAKRPAAASAAAPATPKASAKPANPVKQSSPATAAKTAEPAKRENLPKPAASATATKSAKQPAEPGAKPKSDARPKAAKPSARAETKSAAAGSTAAVAKPAGRPAESAAPPAQGQPRWLGRTALLVYALVAGLLAAAAIVTGVLAATTKQNSDLAFNDARNAVIVDATKDIQTLNALDYRSAAAGINAWLEVSTGSLHDDVTAQHTAILSEVAQKKTVTSATVLSLAVTQLDDRSGSATVMTSVEQIVTPAGQAAVKKFDRFAADLTRIDGSWKIQSITLVPV